MVLLAFVDTLPVHTCQHLGSSCPLPGFLGVQGQHQDGQHEQVGIVGSQPAAHLADDLEDALTRTLAFSSLLLGLEGLRAAAASKE